ncbi:MAG: RdgB/HAM1 family non-canonical purine NTP pyrophosphatase [Clostridia bacterium]|nr:RdgB/HAM1 family non-canonical purine NTP pyrophosphatase [Clostridia bacterium]
MKIVLASRNKHKIGELQALLRKHVPDIEILSLDDVGFTEDIVEDGKDFFENAYIKARAAASTGYIGLGDDSGLSVRSLGGAPGIYSARYAGEHGDDEANNRLLLENLKDKSDRYAEFVCVIACVFPEDINRGHFFEGKTGGVIIDEYRGRGGFGYDPLFLYEPMDKTFAEMSAEEKNSISHRGKAIELLAQKLKTL